MTPQEAAALLTVAAAFDNRKPDVDAAAAWALALNGYRFQDCRDSIVAYYRSHRDWIMPSDVIGGVDLVRINRMKTFERQFTIVPPADLADDPRAENEWLRRVQQRIYDGEITHPDEIDNGRSELSPHDVASLGQLGREIPDA